MDEWEKYSDISLTESTVWCPPRWGALTTASPGWFDHDPHCHRRMTADLTQSLGCQSPRPLHHSMWGPWNSTNRRWSVSACSRQHAQQSHISRVAHRVCPTNARTSVLSNLLDVAIRRAHIPLMPGRSMDACSWIPIPLRIILRDPSLYAPITR